MINKEINRKLDSMKVKIQMNNVLISNEEKSILRKYLEDGNFPEEYRYLKSVIDEKITTETNKSNLDQLNKL